MVKVSTEAHSRTASPASPITLLSLEAVRVQQWQGRRVARSFLEAWRQDTNNITEDLSHTNSFPWASYLLNHVQPIQGAVLGPGVTRFEIKRVAGVSGTSSMYTTTQGRVDYFVTRSDFSQVRLHPHRYDTADLYVLYVDRPGPIYYGHLARQTPWPDGCWGTPLGQSTCRLCPELPAERHGQLTADVIATAAGMEGGLADLMTNADATAALETLDLSPGQEINLSDGKVFPWVRWISKQPTIVNEFAGGVTKFAAVCFKFKGRRTGADIVGRAFLMHTLEAQPLALLPGLTGMSISRLVTDHWGTYPAEVSSQILMEEIYLNTTRAA